MDNFLALLGVLFGLLVLFYFLRWAVRDAIRRGKSPLLVVLILACSFPLGLIAWLLFRPEVPKPGYGSLVAHR